MEVKELMQMLKEHTSEYKLELFDDGSGTFYEFHMSCPDEEILEFKTLEELYKFLDRD